MEKGQTVKIGWEKARIFWIGPCKFNEGNTRVGAKTSDGRTLWADASKVTTDLRSAAGRNFDRMSADIVARNKRRSAREIIAETGMEGTYAATAMLMAEMDPAPDGNPDFWDNWKEEMKEGMWD